MTQIREFGLLGKCRAMGELGEGGDGVDGGIKNKFGPLRWTRVWQSFGLEPGAIDKRGGSLDRRQWSVPRLKGAQPGGGIELILNMGIAVARATHKSGAAN